MSETTPQPGDHGTQGDGSGWEVVPNREVVAGSAQENSDAAHGSGTDRVDRQANSDAGKPGGGQVAVPESDAAGSQVAETDDVDATVVPEVTAPQTGGLSIGMWVSMVVGAVVLVLLLVFILQNNVSTQIHFFGWSFSLPLGVALLLTAVGGLLIAGVVGSIRILQLRHRLRKIGKAFK